MSAFSRGMTGLRLVLGAAVTLVLAAMLSAAPARAASEAELTERFAYLSTHGNSNCSQAFRDSLAEMPPMARLQGSCCSPMDRHRYVEQVNGLEAYRHIAEIPPDPYDIPAGLAQKLIPSYQLVLDTASQAAYDDAMANSDEKGPCCCQCWRWEVYGGLAKFLITEHGFTGPPIAAIWDLSDGCGGSGDHHHAALPAGSGTGPAIGSA